MRGLTDEERSALVIGASADEEMFKRLLARGLVRELDRTFDSKANHITVGCSITVLGLRAVRLDAAARAMGGARG